MGWGVFDVTRIGEMKRKWAKLLNYVHRRIQRQASQLTFGVAEHWLITAKLLWEGWEEYVVQCNGNGRSGLAWFRMGNRELKGIKDEIESSNCSSSRRSETPRNTKMVGEFSGQQVVRRE